MNIHNFKELLIRLTHWLDGRLIWFFTNGNKVARLEKKAHELESKEDHLI